MINRIDEKLHERRLRARIVSDMVSLLSHSADEGLSWGSSKTDLIEMVHILYYSDAMCDADGLPLTFRELVRRACEIVHVTVPPNPSQLVTRARMRKGRRSLQLMKRYKGIEHWLLKP